MFSVDKKNNIKLTRGDDLTIHYPQMDSSGNHYELGENDYLVLTVKEDSSQAEPTFRVQAENGSHDIVIPPALHKDLPFGTYKYDIEVFLGNGKHYTPTAYKDFVITEEVGW